MRQNVDSDDDFPRSRFGGNDSADGDLDFGDEYSSRDDASPSKGRKGAVVANQPFDEAVEVSDSDSLDNAPRAKPPQAKVSAVKTRALFF